MSANFSFNIRLFYNTVPLIYVAPGSEILSIHPSLNQSHNTIDPYFNNEQSTYCECSFNYKYAYVCMNFLNY